MPTRAVRQGYVRMLCDAYAALHEFLEPYTSSPSSAEYSTYVRYSRNSKGKSLAVNERTPDQCSVDQKPTGSFNGSLMRTALMPSIMVRRFLRAYRIYVIDPACQPGLSCGCTLCYCRPFLGARVALAVSPKAPPNTPHSIMTSGPSRGG